MGLIIAADSPRASAIAKNVPFIKSLAGRPNDMFETPSEVFTPILCRRYSSESSAATAAPPSAETAIARVSKMMSFLRIPYFAASLRIFLAISILPSAVAGMPPSSSVSAITAPPYFFTRGNTASITSFLPFTEFTSGLPL